MSNITAINVFIEVDGKQHIAPIREEAADLFMGMLGAFQKDGTAGVTLVPLHDDVAKHLIATRRALLKRIEAHRGTARPAAGRGDMIQFHKLTMEEAVLQSLTDDKRTAGMILSAKDGDTIVCAITHRYEVPANYAKAVLADHARALVQKEQSK